MKSMEKVMQKWKSYGKHFQQNRLYMGILLLTAVCALSLIHISEPTRP